MTLAAPLRRLFPAAPAGHLEALTAGLAPTGIGRGLTLRPLRLAHFLAQVGHETAGLTRLEDDLRYSAARLRAVWPARFPTEQAAAMFAGDPVALAERVYSGRMGNGPEGSGDGWTYRGRGYLPLTGRDAYREAGRRAGLDLEAMPVLAAAPDGALAVALAVWDWKGLGPLADVDDIVAVTLRLNGGRHGLVDRSAWLDRVRLVLGPGKPDAAVVGAAQRALRAAGHDCGPVDGRAGPRTLAALAAFRLARGLGPGGLDGTALAALGVDLT